MQMGFGIGEAKYVHRRQGVNSGRGGHSRLTRRIVMRVTACLGVLTVLFLSTLEVQAQEDFATTPDARACLTQTEHQGAVPPPGTVINAQNWQKYKDFMPPGMQA